MVISSMGIHSFLKVAEVRYLDTSLPSTRFFPVERPTSRPQTIEPTVSNSSITKPSLLSNPPHTHTQSILNTQWRKNGVSSTAPIAYPNINVCSKLMMASDNGFRLLEASSCSTRIMSSYGEALLARCI